MEAISWETIRKVSCFHNQGTANTMQAHGTAAQPSKHATGAVLEDLVCSA